jgi:DNA-binding response OmpR family regulator
MTKILIVDDDAQATSLIHKFLSTVGYDAIEINDSSKVVQLARSISPDLFLLDLMMPEPDGFKLCRQLRAEPSFAQTPIIIITALADIDSQLVAFGAGANDYLTKPYSIHELAKKVKALIE